MYVSGTVAVTPSNCTVAGWDESGVGLCFVFRVCVGRLSSMSMVLAVFVRDRSSLSVTFASPFQFPPFVSFSVNCMYCIMFFFSKMFSVANVQSRLRCCLCIL